MIRAAGVTNSDIAAITARTRRLLEERARLYRGDRPPVSVRGKIVILVDDGIATGASLLAAIHALRAMKPKKLIVAAPVAPHDTCQRLQREVDGLIVLYVPAEFYAVGQFYEHFLQTSDEQVTRLLQQSALPYERLERTEVDISLGSCSLRGFLSIPPRAQTIVVFVHGSGSSRFSVRNQQVAAFMNRNGMATLLFDLLTVPEEEQDRHTASFRFEIELLANRLARVLDWLQRRDDTAHLRVALFGASTGAAAALVAATRSHDAITAIVSRGGRPDLAGGDLREVQSPTLLIVGDRDQATLAMNRQAFATLSCIKQLAIVPGAGHLFEEPGTLDQVAELAVDWIHRWSGLRTEQGHIQRIA